jgi:dethiobiotin synthetase
MKAIFVTGTDTGVGKSVVTGLLARFLLRKGRRVITQKWIETGSRGFPGDIRVHLKLMRKPRGYLKDLLPHVSPYAFAFGASPHLAAGLEKRKINKEKIKKSFKFLSKRFDFVIVEGIGGALVPLSKRTLIIDIAKDMGLPVLIVAGNKLGAINHTLLTVEAIQRRGMDIIGIVFNDGVGRRGSIILRDNPRIVKRISGERILGALPRIRDKNRLYKEFLPIGKRIEWIAG